VPYYLTPTDVPCLTHIRHLPRNYGYVIRREANIYINGMASITHFYQNAYASVKKNIKKSRFAQNYVGTTT